ncbi:MAG: cytidine deaminase [Halobacteriales archaeon]
MVPTAKPVISMHALIERAREAQERAHAPYSEYEVGAALRTVDGTVYTGCNIEFVNYTNTRHAEEVALLKAVEAGERAFDVIAVTSSGLAGRPPCGMCLQSLTEFCDPDLTILSDVGDDYREYTLDEALPGGMPADALVD